ncbi:MAG: glycosyl hydrolase family 17 protein [Myxococcota bacterium]
MSSDLLRTGKLMDGAFVAAGELDHTELSDDELYAKLRALLAEGIHGMCFSAYVGDQSPAAKSVLSEEQVRSRLDIIASSTRGIRTFSCTEGNEHGARLAKERGLETLVGAWIGDSEEKDDAELAAVIEVARAGYADMVAIGNEVLLRGDRSEEQLLSFIRRFKEVVPNVPVGYVDAYFLFPQRPALVEACDFLPINCYPFWEGCPLENAVPYAAAMVNQVKGVAGGKPVIIAETGWPTAGMPERGALPGKRAAALYALNLIPWAARASVPLFWFSAFDEGWKVGAEGDAGACWGFWDADGRPKYA